MTLTATHLTLTHTHAEGTTLEGTARGDGAAEALKTAPGRTRWKWSPRIGDRGRWYIPRSRDRHADRDGIAATAAALRAAGFTVAVTIDNTPRASAVVTDDDGGEDADDGRAVPGREARSTVANRVDKLAAEVARDLRTLHGWWNRWGQINVEYRPVDPDSEYGQDLAERIRANTDARHFWSQVLAAMPGAEVALDQIAPGDVIDIGNRGAFVVARVNRKTFSVHTGLYAGHTQTCRKDAVTAHRPRANTST